MSPLEWFLLIVAGVLAAVLLVTIIGSFVPRTLRWERAMTMPAAPEAVWRELHRSGSLPSAAAGTSENPRTATWTETTGRRPVDVRVAVSEPPRRLQLQRRRGRHERHWWLELTPADGGTVLTVIETASIDSRISRALARYGPNRMRDIDGYLQALRLRLRNAELETGPKKREVG